MDAIDWWGTYASETPELAEVAKKCSLNRLVVFRFSAEKNWSTYSYIHNVKRNRLNFNRTDKLVFIHSNISFQSPFSESHKSAPYKKWDMNPESMYIEGLCAHLEKMVWENLAKENIDNGKGKKARLD
ncbi:putative ribonuclease H-like superfamily [Helianthus annuus]|nr:putative ribonuclease H-like superfamily [Helianthus annuus]